MGENVLGIIDYPTTLLLYIYILVCEPFIQPQKYADNNKKTYKRGLPIIREMAFNNVLVYET